jgi:hypothetical protein
MKFQNNPQQISNKKSTFLDNQEGKDVFVDGSFIEKSETMKSNTKYEQKYIYYQNPFYYAYNEYKRFYDSFPLLKDHIDSYDCKEVFNNKNIPPLVNKLKDVKFNDKEKTSCRFQIFGPATVFDENRMKISTFTNSLLHKQNFNYYNDQIYFNCIGWAIGISEFIFPFAFVKYKNDKNVYQISLSEEDNLNGAFQFLENCLSIIIEYKDYDKGYKFDDRIFENTLMDRVNTAINNN